MNACQNKLLPAFVIQNVLDKVVVEIEKKTRTSNYSFLQFDQNKNSKMALGVAEFLSAPFFASSVTPEPLKTRSVSSEIQQYHLVCC